VTGAGRIRRGLVLLCGAFALALPSQAYYHYIHFNGRNYGAPLYEKFDISALPYKTVTFSVSDQGPASFAPNDSFGSVLIQVRQALSVWNDVGTSDLRVAFGGLKAAGQPVSNTPGGDIVFVDLPPGLLGLGGDMTGATVSPAAGTPFIPIVRSTVMLSRDTNQGAGASYLEAFFTTAVHEIGHALGLQHTWTGSAMSQGVVRNTSRLRPLDADDIAGLSVLYGKPGWADGFGSLAGRVTLPNGQPVALASVVALSPNGSAVSALTNPDGAYRIDGLPAGLSYLVYVHPLPPNVVGGGENLRLPVDLAGTPLPPSPAAFQTVFFRPGGTTLDPQQALAIPANPGATAAVDFTVQQRPSVTTYDVVTYSQLDTATRQYVTAVTANTVVFYPAFLNSTQNWGVILSKANAPASLPTPLSMTILGGFAPATLNPDTWPLVWSAKPGEVGAVFGTPIGAGTGLRHLVYNFGNDIYVLPNGVTLVQKGPPRIDSVTPNPDGTVTIAGAGLAPDSSILFDGLKATIATPFKGDDAQGTIVVTPPLGANGQTATLTVYNPDGQNSMILQAQNPPTYTYPSASEPQISAINYTSLPANSSAAVDITTTDANFTDGQPVSVAFGSDDVTVRRVWVLGPNHLIANIVVAPNAALGSSEISIVSGFQVISQQGGFATLPARPGLPVITSFGNSDATKRLVYPGSIAVIEGQNLVAPTGTMQLTLNDAPAQIVSATPAKITFMVPTNVGTGPINLQLNNGAMSAYPIRVQLDTPPAIISALTNQAGQSLLGGSVGQGDTLNIVVTGIDPGVLNATHRLQVTIGGLPMPIQQVSPAPNGGVTIQALVALSFNGAQVPLIVSVDGYGSLPVTITVR
jgi:uncharacterized protein (TIGR03437 family)